MGKEPERLEGRKGRKTGGEVRSGENAVIDAGIREGRRRVRAFNFVGQKKAKKFD